MSQSWSQGPDGQWTMNNRFTGAFGQTHDALQQQLADSLGKPLDLSSLGELGTGDAARDQAINAAYTQAASRLDPQWRLREESQRTQLLNQGLAENSEAYRNSMGELGRDRNDAYTSAMNSAIGQGTAAGQAVFNQNMGARNQRLQEMLRQRTQPLSEAQSLQQLLTTMPGFQGASAGQAPNALQAAMGQGQYGIQAWGATNQANADMWQSALQLASTAYMMCDERVKTGVQRLETEAMPGVPLATWEYESEPGVRYLGVVAQDVQAVRPDLVLEDGDGLLRVHPSLAPERIS
ncbi:tail fiber domain-containing protein [Myxococcus landrumensis]|uniref:Tail fiber domain-containing protein n=1 Tax=Myxococcus landrumensis TaxID=2813577 RepID=A0ABX7N922_9BACT|nr:tail fiber domain-containing protein [Myxococcus landrumus]QSQ14044.1 tail fiber domain-containing protein [Myxococcus landrumus]